MSKIWWLALIVGGLLYPVKSLALSPMPNCGWCGTSCGEIRPDTACIALAPPEGKSCVFQDGACTIVEKKIPLKCDWCGDKCVEMDPRMMCNKMAPPKGKLCVNNGDKCVIQENLTPTPVPACILKPACIDGIKDPATGKIIYCDPPIGAVFCPTEKKGDANKDGKADLVDFTIWKKESMLRVEGPDASADFDGNGQVNSADFLVWRSSYLVNKK